MVSDSRRRVLAGALMTAGASLVVIATTMTFLAAPRQEVLVGTPTSVMEMVPLKSTQAGMPVVYVMEPVEQKVTPSATTDLAEVYHPKPSKPAARSNLANLPESVAFPLPTQASARQPVAHKAVVRSNKRPVSNQPLATAQERRFEAAYPVETEAQALRRAKILARQDYMKSYQTAIQAENSAEARERKNRIVRAQHEAQRASMFNTLKGRADKKEGWEKLEREMGMIMDGVDGLHYRGYHAA